MQSFSKIEQLEADAIKYPNNIEINQALAEAYAKEGRWEEATEAYQTVVDLYPVTAALNINRIRLGAIALGLSSLLFLISEILRPSIPLMVSIIIGAGLFLPYFAIQAVVMPAAAQLYFKGDTFALDVYNVALSQPLATVFTMGGYLLFVGLTLFNIAVLNSGYLSKWASTLLWIGWLLFLVVTQGLIFIFKMRWIFNPMLIALLIAVGGIGLALGVWKQAALQLTTTTVSPQKADS